MMSQNSFAEFLASRDTLRVYEGNKLVFSSKKAMLVPLMEYLNICGGRYPQVVIFDKLMGNAAALLAIKADCSEVFSPLGSELAIRTLAQNRINYHITEIVLRILRPNGEECPMEKLSVGKKPEEFYQIMRRMVGNAEAI